MASVVYGLCAVTSALCAMFLLNGYRKTDYRFLFWCGLFFLISTLNNLLLVMDKIIFPLELDLSIPRYLVALTALCFLLHGLIYSEEEPR
ncbi:MAG: conserved rane protein of unknown function [Nitrospira sp.]|nr:conserved rane protein of unknown function [Nitrospira sp.]